MDREASRRSLTWLGAGENDKSSVNSSIVEGGDQEIDQRGRREKAATSVVAMR